MTWSVTAHASAIATGAATSQTRAARRWRRAMLTARTRAGQERQQQHEQRQGARVVLHGLLGVGHRG